MKKYSKYLFPVLCLFLLSASGNILFAQKDENKAANVNQIRFDGLYSVDNAGSKSYSYFRFCKNGTVTGMSATFDAKRVWKWLVCEPDRQKYSVGKYTIDGNKISFTTKSENGEVDYDGIIEKKAVVLNVSSRINKSSARNRKYKFIEISPDEN